MQPSISGLVRSGSSELPGCRNRHPRCPPEVLRNNDYALASFGWVLRVPELASCRFRQSTRLLCFGFCASAVQCLRIVCMRLRVSASGFASVRMCVRACERVCGGAGELPATVVDRASVFLLLCFRV